MKNNSNDKKEESKKKIKFISTDVDENISSNSFIDKHQMIKNDFSEDRKMIDKAKEEIKEDIINERKQLEKMDIIDILKRLFTLKEDVAEYKEIEDRILSGGKFRGTNMCVLMLAIFIASVGLNTGSTAVIIGAMLISPLMGSILAMAYGTVTANMKRIVFFGTAFIVQILISVCTASFYFLLSPIKAATSEIIARTSPSFYDIIIAFCGGLAGIIGQTRKDKANNIIPGVAIATALMPPLCTCGYAIANAHWSMLLGAGYLFVINTYFIYFASVLVLSILEISNVKHVGKKKYKRIRGRLIRNGIIITIPCILLCIWGIS